MKPEALVSLAGWRGKSAQALAGAVLLALLVACGGSNVPRDRIVAANGGLTVPGTAGGVVTGPDGAVVPGAGATAGGGTVTGTPGAAVPDAGVPATAGGGTGSAGGTTGGGSGTSTGGKVGVAGSGGVPGAIITNSCSGTGSGTVKIGANESYSAAGAQPSAPMIGAMNAWADYVNKNGGICGRKVQMVIKDDANSASSEAANYKTLVESDKVVAIVNSSTQNNASAWVPYVSSKKIAQVGGDQATGDWWKNPVFFPIGASVSEIAVAQYKLAQKEPSGSKVAILYCAEVAACSDNYKYQVRAKIPEAAGSKFVYAKQISLTQISFASECQAAAEAGAGVILAYGDTGLIKRLAANCAQQGLKFGYITITVSNDMPENQYLDNHTYVSQTMQPWMATNTPGIQFIRGVLTAAGVSVESNSVYRFASMLMLQQALTALGGQAVTPASVLKSLQTNVRNYTMGGVIGATTYGSGAQAQGRCSGGAVIQGGRWVPANGGDLRCRSGAALPLP